LNVKENIILTEKNHKFYLNKKHLNSLKDGFEIVNGKFISKISKEIYNYRELKDSIELTNKDVDTFFIFSNTQKAKRINGNLVINEKDSVFWSVKLINLDKKNIKITQIYSASDLKKMDSITKNKSTMIDSSSFIIKPSRKEFSKFINLKNFGDQQKFKKISK
jgi:SpoU rRNA methylase family enzyme